MFGYVRPSVRDLPEEELDRFRAMYCCATPCPGGTDKLPASS